MPYVLNKKRKLLDPYLKEIYQYYISETSIPKGQVSFPYDAISKLVENIDVNGDLNYCLSWLCWKVFLSNKRYATADKIIDVLEWIKSGHADSSESFGSFGYVLFDLVERICRISSPPLGSILGTITCVQFEFYRRHVGFYEDLAIQKNGDLEL